MIFSKLDVIVFKPLKDYWRRILLPDTPCIICNQFWQIYKGKKSERWLICDIYDGYECLKCSPKGLDENDDFYYDKFLAGDI